MVVVHLSKVQQEAVLHVCEKNTTTSQLWTVVENDIEFILVHKPKPLSRKLGNLVLLRDSFMK